MYICTTKALCRREYVVRTMGLKRPEIMDELGHIFQHFFVTKVISTTRLSMGCSNYVLPSVFRAYIHSNCIPKSSLLHARYRYIIDISRNDIPRITGSCMLRGPYMIRTRVCCFFLFFPLKIRFESNSISFLFLFSQNSLRVVV